MVRNSLSMVRKALVTGTSKGIGKAVAIHLLAKGYEVIGLSRTSPWSAPQFFHIPCDLSKSELPEIPGVDVAILNAGAGLFKKLEELSHREMEHLFQLNVLSQMRLAKAVLPTMKREGRGDIVFIGSEAGLQGKKEGTLYCATKFALRGFSQALREECRYSGVRISLVNPGLVKTPFFEKLHFTPGEHPHEHLLPEEVARSIEWIISAREGCVAEEITLRPQRNKVLKT